MAGSVLTALDRARLLALTRRQLNSTVHRRMNVLLLLDDGWTAERITLAPLMAEAGAETPRYFVDASHPAYTGHPACGWIKRGQTRELKSHHGRVNVTINGALSWPEREVVRREAGKITSAAMIELFDDLAARHPTATAIRVVLDNASYNHSNEIKTYLDQPGCRIKLVYPPAYAPNLNLIERLWWLLKKAVLYH